MATMDDNPLFIDTNILVYANVIETPFHEQALAAINTAHQAGRTIWISRQVIREYLVTLTRPQV
jgi:predicted nucleic acid-binding protein